MIPVWWSVLLTVMGGLGWLLVTLEHRIQGFCVGIAAQVAWISYAVVTQQWGFIVSALLFGAINALGLYRWWSARRPRPEPSYTMSEPVEWTHFNGQKL